ncbi:MAG: ATP-binding protein, partial [Pseudomonadota bacterium]
MQWSIMDFLSTEGFRPHGLCLQWRADVFWAHIISDVLIALSYFSIPVALVYFAFHRTDFNYRWVLYLFGTFIVACGITHAFGIWTMWVPDYGMQAVAKGMTALVSVATAVALWPLMPRLLAIPSTLELAQKNEALAEEIATREHVEQELRHLNNELELRVSDRTAQLEQRNADLVTAQRAAEKSSAAKSEFLASMSHEVRTPMNGVLGMLDLLQGARLSSDEQEMVRRAKYAADGLLEVINDILDYSKLEAGSVELSRHPFSPAQTVSDVVAMLQSRAGQKGLTLSCVLPEDLPPRVLGDERRFRQVLVNLVGNAIKFTPAGTVSVHVVRTGQSTTKGTGQSKMQGTEEDMGQDASVGLAVGVSDTGIGIDPKAAGNLFQRFQQADPSISRRFGGTGLGLAISKQLVELMGGNISVESNPG